ncbi:hypothetical protein DL769_010080 [Monosporascus sp. CRB-8-3]|nr:hypothetical protein DL769_010080 [Monosporascus sp. CRB-8-3]
MGRPPAYIFVVRHGKRLDAADRQWHLSSPTPYDPPLTYGGWMQSRTVGARMASILQEREAEDEAASRIDTSDTSDGQRPKRKKKRYRIIIHSSPFLRCVQTSIAISAGLASSPFPSLPSPSNNVPTKSKHAISTSAIPALSSSASHHIPKSVLRLDSFLGEWLSPDYFEHITPPPRSMLMLATAKAELLRRENYNDYPHFHARHTPHTSGQLWSAGAGSTPRFGSPLASSTTPSSGGASGLENLSSLNDVLAADGGGGHGTKRSDQREAPGDYFHNPLENRIYTPPVPAYAISSSQPIPRGYVAHARDACVNVDYQWDSTRDSLGWGDGGVLPEEWAAMHQRFRRGLRRLVDWYTTAENPGEMVTKFATNTRSHKPHLEAASREVSADENSEDVEIENVVILVSHGAGCNALVGAITQQPVLADVGMSSLTMAQRRPEFDDHTNSSNDRPVSSLDEGLLKARASPADMFELKLFANTDHLLAPTPMTASRSSSVSGTHGSPGGLFSGSYTSALRDVNLGDSYVTSAGGSRSNSLNASLGSIRRGPQSPAPAIGPLNYTRPSIGGVTVGSGATNFLGHRPRPERSSSLGLWQPRQNDGPENRKPETPMLLDFSHEKETEKKPETTGEAKREPPGKKDAKPVASPQKAQEEKEEQHDAKSEERDTFDETPVTHLWAGTGNGGLWGAPRPPGEAERLRDFSSTKRRWTVNER